MLWLMPQVKAFCQRLSPSRIELHMCAYSSPHRKPTSFLTSARCLALIGKLCPGKSATHVHEALSGTVVVDGKQIYKTKLAQVYPHQLCETYALAASFVFNASRRDVVVAQAEALRRRSAREGAATEPQMWRLMSSCPQNSLRPHWSSLRSAMRCRRAVLIRSVWDPLTWTAPSSRTLFL